MKKVICAIVAFVAIVVLPICLERKDRKEKEEKSAEYEASTLGKFDYWQDSLDICILDALFVKDTIEVISDTPLEECALVIISAEEQEILNFKYVGMSGYQIDITQSSIRHKLQSVRFIITKYKQNRNTFSIAREEFIKEFSNLAPALILKTID